MHWSSPLYVDLHNHILPGIDDGAVTLAEALDMARLAVADGTDTMAATPHRAHGLRRSAKPAWIQEQVALLQAALDDARIPLLIIPGVEIPVGPRVAADLAQGDLSALGSSRTVLIEPPFERIPHDALENLLAVRDAGFQIILAHPERNAVIQRDLAFAEACGELGFTLQLTSGSLLGRFGLRVQQTAEALLARAKGWPLIIASDTHDLTDRAPNLLSAARAAAAKIVGEAEALAMVDSRPRSLITPG